MPALRRKAGARFAVIRRWGKSYPELRIADRARSRDSRTAASPSPTIVNAGSPWRMSTSTHTIRGSTPSMANVATRASIARSYDESRHVWVSRCANSQQSHPGIGTELAHAAYHVSRDRP